MTNGNNDQAEQITTLTADAILTHEYLHQYQPIPGHVSSLLGLYIDSYLFIPRLCLIADMIRVSSPGLFHFLDLNATDGGVLCAMMFHKHQASREKYAGIVFDKERSSIEPEEKTTVIGEANARVYPQKTKAINYDINVADRNIRYFGKKDFALFQGKELSETLDTIHTYLNGKIHFLYMRNAQNGEVLNIEFDVWSQAVEPGGVVVFGNYNNERYEGVTEAIDNLDKSDWNDVGSLAPGKSESHYVLQRKEPRAT